MMTKLFHVFLENASLRKLVADPFYRFSEGMKRVRTRHELSELACLLSPKLEVLAGPLSGIRYPSALSHGSTFVPKLLGTYESEIGHVIESFEERGVKEFCDIGCAEGYYAVGVAKRFRIPVKAYDLSDRARELCAGLAKENGVEELVELRVEFTGQNFKGGTSSQRRFFFSDCEGFEEMLFTKQWVEDLLYDDCLVEVHDFLDRKIETQICEAYGETHEIEKIAALTDLEKARGFDFSKYQNLSDDQKYKATAEGRTKGVLWLWIRSKKAIS